jgi:hypothetical protein
MSEPTKMNARRPQTLIGAASLAVRWRDLRGLRMGGNKCRIAANKCRIDGGGRLVAGSGALWANRGGLRVGR